MHHDGLMSEIPNVSVDSFLPHTRHCVVYLLSHFHMDHTRGLFDYENGFNLETIDHINNKDAKIICSRLTMNFLLSQNGEISDRLIKILKSIEVQDTIYVDLKGCRAFNLTALSAGHCPGSLMFLLEIQDSTHDTKNVLYTGDFRYDSSQIEPVVRGIKRRVGERPIHTLYCDMTFSNKHERQRTRHFPLKQSSLLWAF
ncbi:hypothetical protein ACOME3_000494 [Neoechinorhynchus agilis]